MNLASSIYKFIITFIVALIRCILVGAPVGLTSVGIYTSFLEHHNYTRADLGAGLLSVAFIGLVAGFSFTFGFGFGSVEKLGKRLALEAFGGFVFGFLHGLLWINDSYASFLGFWSFFCTILHFIGQCMRLDLLVLLLPYIKTPWSCEPRSSPLFQR